MLAYPLIDLLYGSDFEDAALPLILLAPTIFLYPPTYIAAYVLISQDRQSALAWVYGSVAVVNIGLNLVLIPAVLARRAAFVTSLSQLLSATIMVTLALRASGRVDTRTILGGACVASALAGGTMALLHDEFLLAAPAGALVYVVVLALFERRFHPHDYERVMSFVRRRPAEPSAGGAPESEQLQT